VLVILSNLAQKAVNARALTAGACLSVKLLLLLVIGLMSAQVFAQRGVFLSVDAFVAQSFDAPASAKTLWLNPEQKQAATDILSRNPGLRSRYYRLGDKTAWVLEEIGKELPITVGVVVDQGRVLSLQVLEYREVRGGEVRYESFTQQFVGIGFAPDSQQLDKRIDGISGATLSVRALQKIARLALYFHQQVVVPPDEAARVLCSENIGGPSCGAGTSG